MSVPNEINALACLGTNLLIADLSAITGPFFLGFAMESFAMGIVAVLAIDYLGSIAIRRKLPSESPRRLGVALVIYTLLLTTSQTVVDLYRGFRYFGTNFMNISKFLSPNPLFFVSPFLGILSALITQLFLLRRIVRFLSSLDLLWPILSKPIIKYAFATCMILAILVSAIEGTIASAMIMNSGGIAKLGLGLGNDTADFQARMAVWLGAAVAVDAVLCSLLCVELWWARRKLSMKGTTMQEFMTRLILITFHGGLAVTSLQVAGLLLYYYQKNTSWSYFPLILLPKVYSITLILSISLPQHTSHAGPSQVISLPTINPSRTQHDDTLRTASGTYGGRRASSPAVLSPYTQPGQLPPPARRSPYLHAREPLAAAPRNEPVQVETAYFQRPSPKLAPILTSRWSDVLRRSWRRSQTHVQGMSGLKLFTGAGGDGGCGVEKEDEVEKGRWIKQVNPESPQTPTRRPASDPDLRRPSLMPLMSTPSPRSSTWTQTGRRSTFSALEIETLPRHVEELGERTSIPSGSDSYDPSSVSTAVTYSSNGVPRSYPLAEPPNPTYPPATYPSPRSAEAHIPRLDSLSGWSPTSPLVRRMTDPPPHHSTSLIRPGPVAPPLADPVPHPGADNTFHFDTLNPFDSVYSLNHSTASQTAFQPTASMSQVPLVPPLPEIVEPNPTLDRRKSGNTVPRRSSWLDPGGFDDEEAELRAGRARGRMLSFQDFLAGVPDHESDEGGRNSRRGSRSKRGSPGGG